MTQRTVTRRIAARDTRDGAGVSLKRSLGGTPGDRIDPFLMLDEFYSDRAEDYIAGFPAHPHRGFETVTYMLAGNMQHRDHMGNEGNLGPGDVQWMTAGRGVIHSEMPQQREGLLRGFQLWVNLPADEKMRPAVYQDIDSARIPVYRGGGFSLHHIAGELALPDGHSLGYVNGLDGQQYSTQPVYADIRFASARALKLGLPAGHNAAVYCYDGSLEISGKRICAGTAALLSPGDSVVLDGEPGCGALLIAGKPIGEPVVQYGPFVMNSNAEIEQALRDYRDGTLTD